MKPHSVLALLVPATLVTAVALADDKATCLDAASKGQRFKDNHKLLEAREQLRVCAAAVCPAVVQADCATWLAEVDAALPSVVLTAKNGAGVDLVDVKVSMDGQPLVPILDGHAVRVNGGPHTFHFAGADGASLDKLVVVREGEKNQDVAVVLAAPPAAHPAGPSAGSTAETAGAGSTSQPPPAADTSNAGGSSSTIKTLGWVLGAAGVAGLGVGTVFGLIAMDEKSSHCSNNVCDPGSTGGIKSDALVSDVGWIAGGILLAGGAALVLFAPSGSGEPGAGIRLSPVVTASGAGILTEGSW